MTDFLFASAVILCATGVVGLVLWGLSCAV
jgi:hypothetical protein